MTTVPQYVRCLDNTLVRDVLKVDRIYPVRGEQDGNYLVEGKWLLRGRFRPATAQEWMEQGS